MEPHDMDIVEDVTHVGVVVMELITPGEI